jgi:hypothetical protein
MSAPMQYIPRDGGMGTCVAGLLLVESPCVGGASAGVSLSVADAVEAVAAEASLIYDRISTSWSEER